MYSIIEWKKGTPPKTDYYIVISKDGQVDVVRWYVGYWQCSFEVYGWREIWNVEIYNKGGMIMESIIKWQTGEPKKSDYYLVCTKDGYILIDHYTVDAHNWVLGNVDKSEVSAWCKLSDIEPYKEEVK